MYGLMVIGALVIYAVVSLAVVMYATINGGKLGGPGWLWGLVAAFVMYNLVFWDYLPTVYAHKYYCEKEAGFWIYKTLDQWTAENPGVMERLVSYNRNSGGFNVDWPFQGERGNDGHLNAITNHINERFNELVIQQDVSNFLPIIREEYALLDVKKNEVMARYVDFGTGNSVKETVGPPGPLKFWLHKRNCIGGKESQIKFSKFYIQFKGSEK